MQPDGTKVRAFDMPTDIHHPNPQSGLVEIIARQTYEIASTGRRVMNLKHGPDEDSITDRGEWRLPIEGERCRDQGTRP